MTDATRLSATARAERGTEDWRLYLDDITSTSTDGVPIGTWWATGGATPADQRLVAFQLEAGDVEAEFAPSWVDEGIQVLDGDTLVGVPVDVAYSDTVETVADLVGAYSQDGADTFEPTWPDGLISLPIKSLTELIAESGGGGGGSSTLAGLTDVDLTDPVPENLNSLMFDEATGKWRPGVPAGGEVFAAGFVIGVASVDGTATEVAGAIAYSPPSEATDLTPDGWSAGYVIPMSTVATQLGDSFPTGARVLVWSDADSAWSMRFLTSTTLDDPWPEVAASVVLLDGRLFDLSGGNLYPRALPDQVQDLWFYRNSARDALHLYLHSLTVTAPTAWLTAGGDFGYWACPVLIPSPTDTLVIESWVRFVASNGVAPFSEGASEPLDEGIGADDRSEQAVQEWHGDLIVFSEATEIGAAQESWLVAQRGPQVQDPQLSASAPGFPPGTWVRIRTYFDLTERTVAIRVQLDSLPDFTDPDDDTKWRTLEVNQTGAISSLEASSYTEQWMGRGGGEFHIARVRQWNDGVEVSDRNASTSTDGAVAFDDSVLLDEFDDPAVWTATGTASVVFGVSTDAATEGYVDAAIAGLGLGSLATASTVTSSDITDGTIVAADLAAALLRRIPTTVLLASNAAVTSSTTPVNITGFAVSYVNGDVIKVDADLSFTGDPAGDLRLAATFTNATVRIGAEGPSSAASSAPANTQFQGEITTTGGTVDVGCQTGTQHARVFGTIVASGTGTFQLQHCQRVSNGTATTVLAQSTFTTVSP